MNDYRILVVDDEEDLCEILKFNLENEGYFVDTANSAEEALKMELTQYNLLLLDVMMGEISGFKMANMLKKNKATASIPIIFITAKDTENDTVTGFNLGADDYISKPFSLREVIARVKAVLRRTSPTQGKEAQEQLQYKGLLVDITKKKVSIDGIEISLTKKEFQIVLSRRFIQRYEGDDFKLYRALRSINPSPYLFYFDFGGFRIFGSSPETHCKIENGRATIDPIAGTTRRNGDKKIDAELTANLLADPKENAEHVMLVDLARNDLSRNCHDVQVEFYKEAQYYSHVIHLVSRVSGELNPKANPIKAFIDTFPAGTLSGAPKVKAMQLISEYEPHSRGAYGGCIGFIGLNGTLNQAITIRTFVSRNNELWFQAGGGIVAKSNEEYELQEVNNKLGALKKAIILAEQM